MTQLRVVPHHGDFIWRNGEFLPWEQATVHVSAMGASGGLSVFEGINGYLNPESGEVHIVRLERHLERLMNSMKLTRMWSRFGPAELTQTVLELCRRNRLAGDTYIRPVAYYSGAEHSTFSETIGEEADLVIWTRPFLSMLGSGRVVTAGVSSWTRIADNVIPARIKCMSNYQNNRMAAIESKQNGYDTAFMLDAQGKLAEGPGAAIFIVREGTVYTPPVTAGILESITRETVIEWLRTELGVPVVERPVDRTELYIADEVFQCGTAAEVAPVVQVDRLAVGTGKPGPISLQVEEMYHRVVRGRDPRSSKYLTTLTRAELMGNAR
jgi:branched-chain amino acid aminotransferase